MAWYLLGGFLFVLSIYPLFVSWRATISDRAFLLIPENGDPCSLVREEILVFGLLGSFLLGLATYMVFGWRFHPYKGMGSIQALLWFVVVITFLCSANNFVGLWLDNFIEKKMGLK